jgi:chaperonin GroEL (HSP60 family)
MNPRDKSKVTVTNDGATILKSIYIDNPAAKILIGKNLNLHF